MHYQLASITVGFPVSHPDSFGISVDSRADVFGKGLFYAFGTTSSAGQKCHCRTGGDHQKHGYDLLMHSDKIDGLTKQEVL